VIIDIEAADDPVEVLDDVADRLPVVIVAVPGLSFGLG
jgi:hypothetical protein